MTIDLYEAGRQNQWFGRVFAAQRGSDSAVLTTHTGSTKFLPSAGALPGQQGSLFEVEHYPTKIHSLHATENASDLVSLLLAHAHRVHNGELTHGSSLSKFSLPIAKKGLAQGWIKPIFEKTSRYAIKTDTNPENYLSDCECDCNACQDIDVYRDVSGEIPEHNWAECDGICEDNNSRKQATRREGSGIQHVQQGFYGPTTLLPEHEITASMEHLRGLFKRPKPFQEPPIDHPTLPGTENYG